MYIPLLSIKSLVSIIIKKNVHGYVTYEYIKELLAETVVG